jgi:chemotaxis protein methyltransferase CheR
MDLHERLFINFYNALNGGGYFVMGKTEMLTGKAREMFECIDSKERIYRKPGLGRDFSTSTSAR